MDIKKFILQEVEKLHKVTLLEGERNKIEGRLRLLAERTLLTEETIDDYFKFLESNPHKHSFAYAYYTYPVTLNKNIISNGEKIPNPMYGKIFKNIKYEFNYGKVYVDAMKRINPDYTPGLSRGTYEKVQGYQVTVMGKSGLYLPIMPTHNESNYSVNDDGGWKVVTFDEIKPYYPDRNYSSPAAPIEYKQLILDRIYRISAGGNVWNNPNFKYKYLGPGKV